jgi:hypothetical protein
MQSFLITFIKDKSKFKNIKIIEHGKITRRKEERKERTFKNC